jgi:hypothetical protein
MTIKQQGGVFGRNPNFNDVKVENLPVFLNMEKIRSTMVSVAEIASNIPIVNFAIIKGVSA